jgi:hypothetical protein
VPGNVFPPLYADLTVRNSGIRHPVLVDVVSGEIHPMEWKTGTPDVLPNMPTRDTVLAIVDEDYMDWPVLPESPSSLSALVSGGAVRLRWEVHGGDAHSAVIERRIGPTGPWSRIATQPVGTPEYVDQGAQAADMVCYRVRLMNANGESAYSNIVRVRR